MQGVVASMLPYTDNHLHLDPFKGEGVNAAKKFEKLGLKRIFLVNKMRKDVKARNFDELYEFTIKLAEKVRENTGLEVYVVVGVHPVEVVELYSEYESKTLDICTEGIDKAIKLIEEGKAIALGEVGRPHFEVENEIIEICHKLLTYIFERAKEIDCAVQLHTESLTPTKLEEIVKIAKKVGLSPKRIIKHFSPVSLVKECEKLGVFPSLISSRSNIVKALKYGKRFLMESDYLDDLSRPGAVVSPANIPKVGRYLVENGLMDEDELFKIHGEYIEEAYNL